MLYTCGNVGRVLGEVGELVATKEALDVVSTLFVFCLFDGRAKLPACSSISPKHICKRYLRMR